MQSRTTETVEQFSKRFVAWCESHGLAPSTVTVRILGRSNGLDLLRRRDAKNREDMKRLSKHMEIAQAGDAKNREDMRRLSKYMETAEAREVEND